MLLLLENEHDIFDFVKEAVPAWQNVPVYHFNEIEKIIDFFKKELNENIPVLNGLVWLEG
jgi:hypothetical protein